MTDTQSIDSMIENLSNDLSEVKPLPHPLLRVLPLIGISVFYLFAMVAMLGPREDWMPKMFNEISYLFEIGLSLSVFISAAMALCWMSVPDMRGQTWLKAVPVTLLGVFVGWAGLRIYFEWGEPLMMSLGNCSLDGLFLTAVPVFILTLMARRGATTQPGWSAFMSILSFSGLAWAGLRFTCGANTFLQSLVIHFIPFVVLGIVFALFARRIFKW